jgi:large subunit ribosomal protein L15
MNILSNLKYSEGSRKKKKRIGRGTGSGHGKTSTRGHKGAGSRSGNKRRAWFEGGQMPLQRRLPKFGFNNPGRTKYQELNLGKLQTYYDSGSITEEILNVNLLFESGIISKKNLPLKILGNGEIKQKVEITANKFTKSAIEKIEKAGGKAIAV